jgi:hypothetical protein
MPVTGRGGLLGCEMSRLPHFCRQSVNRWQLGQPYAPTSSGDFLPRLEDEHFTAKNISSAEVTFHLYEHGNRHNLRIWRSNNPHVAVERDRDDSKLDVFSLDRKSWDTFSCRLHCVGIAYIGTTEKFLGPIVEENDSGGILLQQDGAPPCFQKEVTEF